jgi:hypothetical protein
LLLTAQDYVTLRWLIVVYAPFMGPVRGHYIVGDMFFVSKIIWLRMLEVLSDLYRRPIHGPAT